MITIRIPTQLRSRAGGAAQITAEGKTVGEVLTAAGAEYPELIDAIVVDGTLHRFINVYVDDDDVRYIGGLEAPVADGQEVSLLPAVAGGAG